MIMVIAIKTATRKFFVSARYWLEDRVGPFTVSYTRGFHSGYQAAKKRYE